MKVCCIDNPKTLARECWVNGQIAHSYQMHALGEIQRSGLMFFGANVGAWCIGAYRGDIGAIDESAIEGFSNLIFKVS